MQAGMYCDFYAESQYTGMSYAVAEPVTVN